MGCLNRVERMLNFEEGGGPKRGLRGGANRGIFDGGRGLTGLKIFVFIHIYNTRKIA